MALTATLAVNYGRVEARFPNEDLLRVSVRRALNLTEDWLLSVISQEDWENQWREILTSNSGEAKRLQEQREKWGEAQDGKPGAFILERLDEQPATPAINFGSTPAP